MAMHLKKAGINEFQIVEKGSGVGGTWYHNTYPGAECDVQSHLYSYSFEPKLDWSQPFAGQAEILDYLNGLTDKYNIRKQIQFQTAIRSAHWSDEKSHWSLKTDTGEEFTTDVLVSAIGMFNNIVWPDIKGISDFGGDYFHSARWNHKVDLKGKKVGVVGIAASAIQFTPEIVKDVEHLYMYQRTANWVVPKPNTPYTTEQLDHFRTNPSAVQENRDEIYKVWNTLATFKDKAALENIEKSGLEMLAEVKDQETRAQLKPQHPFGCRRPLFSDVYYPIFNRDNVSLITNEIDKVTSSGVLTNDGSCHEVDVLIYSTGFETTTYLNAMDVTGREGLPLKDAWEDGAQAYKGITTAGFPNLFMLYGPNTNQGCIIFMLERQVEYIMRQLNRLDSEKLSWLDVKPGVMAQFNEKIQADANNIDVWQAACGGEFYYRAGKSGRFVTNYPDTMDEFTRLTASEDQGAFEVQA